MQRNDDGRILARYTLGFVAVADGDLVRGAEYLEQAVAAFRANDDIARLVPALYWFAFVVDALGETDRAASIYEEELALTESRGEILWRSMTMSDYGSALWRHGNHARGIELLEDSLRLLRGLGNQFGCAWCLEEIAWTLVDRDAKLAATLMGAADTLFTATGSPMDTFRSMVPYHENSVTEARNRLGDRVFQTAFDHGRALTLDDAAARALREQPPGGSPKSAADEVLTPREQQVAELVRTGPDQPSNRGQAGHFSAHCRRPRRSHTEQTGVRLAHQDCGLGAPAHKRLPQPFDLVTVGVFDRSRPAAGNPAESCRKNSDRRKFSQPS